MTPMDDPAAAALSGEAAPSAERVAAPPRREPRIWLRRRGGLIVLTDSGERVVIPLYPREMRSLGVRLSRLATEIDGEQPSRIGEDRVDE